MENSKWLNYKIQVRERLKVFVLNILRLSEGILETTRGKVVNYQFPKSGTSAYANYRTALRGQSKTEFFSKLSICAEEADKTEMWPDLLICSGLLNYAFIHEIHVESIELLKILASMRKRSNTQINLINSIQSIPCTL